MILQEARIERFSVTMGSIRYDLVQWNNERTDRQTVAFIIEDSLDLTVIELPCSVTMSDVRSQFLVTGPS